MSRIVAPDASLTLLFRRR